MTFTSDEIILALMSLVRVTHPSMLRQEADGFTVDFEAVEQNPNRNDNERLLLKLRPLLETAGDGTLLVLDFDTTESELLSHALERLETAQTWPADVLSMSRYLRQRLTSAP
jgi:hypothetical protein